MIQLAFLYCVAIEVPYYKTDQGTVPTTLAIPGPCNVITMSRFEYIHFVVCCLGTA